MEGLRVGVVGFGGIFNCAHKPTWKASDKAQIVAICDINPKKLEKAKAEFGGKVQYFTDYKEMIDTIKPDVVDICTPNYVHSPIACYALDHGCHTFCEKPDSISVEDVIKMKEAQDRSGKVLMVMRNNRHLGGSQMLKKMIADGELGEIYTGRCGWIRKRGIPGKGGWFTTKAMSGGGPLIDLGVHMIDLALYMMGNPKPVSVVGSTYCKFANDEGESDSVHSNFGEKVEGGTFDVEDLATGFIKFDNGASLQIEFSWASNIEKETRFVELRGTKKGAKWQDNFFTLYDGKKNKKINDLILKWKQLNYGDRLNGHGGNLLHFIDVIVNDAKPDYVIDQGIDMIKILCAIYESAKTGKEVQL